MIPRFPAQATGQMVVPYSTIEKIGRKLKTQLGTVGNVGEVQAAEITQAVGYESGA